jgi:hypothetical protein
MQPSDDVIARIKSQYPDRPLSLIEAINGDDSVLHVVLTGPLRHEYNDFYNQLLKASEMKNAGDKLVASRNAIEAAVLNQVRWPDKDDVKRAFENRPQMIDAFAKTLEDLSGANIELRAKKL